MSTEIKYQVVSSVSIEDAMKASGLATGAKRKADKQDGVVWNQTVCTAMSLLDLSTVSRDTSKEGISSIREVLVESMSKHILASVVIPETGKDRSGSTFQVCGKDGIPKWSSWDQTRRIWAYLGDIAKIIAFKQEGSLYPEENKVGARCDVLGLCKVPEDTMKGVKRLTKELQDRLDVVPSGSEVDSYNLISALAVNNLDPVVETISIVNKLDNLLSCLDEDDKDKVRNHMNILIKHFS